MDPVDPVVQVDPVDLRIVQLVQAVPVDPVDLAVPEVPEVPVVVAPVHALVRADQRPARLDGREASHHVAVSRKGPSVKSLTTWRRPRWVVFVCLEEMAIASDFHAVPV